MTLLTKGNSFFYREFFDYQEILEAINENDFIKVDGRGEDDICLIPKSNIDFIKIEHINYEGN